MNVLHIRADSLEYVVIPVDVGGDPTTASPYFMFCRQTAREKAALPPDQVIPDVVALGEWETEDDSSVPSFAARVLVGPGAGSAGGAELPPGAYIIVFNPRDNPEKPSRNIGLLNVI